MTDNDIILNKIATQLENIAIILNRTLELELENTKKQDMVMQKWEQASSFQS